MAKREVTSRKGGKRFLLPGRKRRSPEKGSRQDRWPTVNVVLTRDLISDLDWALEEIYQTSGAHLTRSEAIRASLTAFLAKWEVGELDASRIHSERDLMIVLGGLPAPAQGAETRGAAAKRRLRSKETAEDGEPPREQ